MKIEEKLQGILDAYEVKKDKILKCYDVTIYGTRFAFYRIKQLEKVGFEILDISTNLVRFNNEYHEPDCYVDVVLRVVRKKKQNEGGEHIG